MRDSHELYDYENTNMKRKSFDTNLSSKFFLITNYCAVGILRNDDELSSISERDYFA